MTTHSVSVPETDQTCLEFSVAGLAAAPLEGFVIRHSGQLRAYVNRCPHTGAPLNWNPHDFLTADGAFIQCSLHGALFDPLDGRCLRGPCVGDQLQSMAIRREGNGWVVETT